jgi:hypothetical protein
MSFFKVQELRSGAVLPTKLCGMRSMKHIAGQWKRSCIGSRSVKRAIHGPAGQCHTNTEDVPTGVNAGSAQRVDIKPSWMDCLPVALGATGAPQRFELSKPRHFIQRGYCGG